MMKDLQYASMGLLALTFLFAGCASPRERAAVHLRHNYEDYSPDWDVYYYPDNRYYFWNADFHSGSQPEPASRYEWRANVSPSAESNYIENASTQ